MRDAGVESVDLPSTPTWDPPPPAAELAGPPGSKDRARADRPWWRRAGRRVVDVWFWLPF